MLLDKVLLWIGLAAFILLLGICVSLFLLSVVAWFAAGLIGLWQHIKVWRDPEQRDPPDG